MPRVRRRATIHVDAAPDVVAGAARHEVDPGGNPPGTSESGGTIAATVTPDGTGCALEVTVEDESYVPYFQWFFGHAFKRRLTANATFAAERTAAVVPGGTGPKPPKRSLFLPPVSFTERQAGLIAAVAMAAVLAGFGSALFGQNTGPISDSFHVSDADLGIALAVTRFGVLASLVATALADRRGRRIVLIWSLVALCAANLVSALSPDIEVFTAA